MSLQAFIPELWTDVLLTELRKELVYAGPGIVNHDYEGVIENHGDTVRITSISRPTVTQYVPGVTSLTPQPIITAGRALLIDQAWAFDFAIDDVDAAQAAGSVMQGAMEQGAYAIAEKMDLNVASLYTQAQSANVIAGVSLNIGPSATWATQAALAYDTILVPLKVKLDEANVPQNGRYCVVPPWLNGVLVRDSRFIKVNESGTDTGLRNGMVARAAGFDILLSNNTPIPTANNYVVTAGVPAAITFASQVTKMEPFRPHNMFADAVKALSVWGSKVIRPDCLATCTVTQTNT